ncbi:MAG: hypothetical protein IKU82_07180 [Clostridia bacterium]|nr:hypothetical protein [Clostridia bacterium]
MLKRFVLICIALSFLTLCGCNGYREIERGYLVSAVGFKQNKNEVTIAVNAMSPGGINDNDTQSVTLYANGKTLFDAYNALKSQLVNPLYFDHLGAVVIEDSAVSLLAEIIDFCKDLPEVSLGLYVVLTPDLQSLFESESPSDMLGYDIMGLIENYGKQNGVGVDNQLYKLQKILSSGGKISLPTVNVTHKKLVLSEGLK